MTIFSKRLLTRRRTGLWELNLGAEQRELLAVLAGQLDATIADSPDDPSLQRLFPPAYPDDVAHEAEWQVFKSADLRASRQGHLAVLRAIATRTTLDDDDVEAWMLAINALRLVLGTRLDAGEDEPSIEPDDPDAPMWMLYEFLGALLAETIDALNR